MVEELTDFKERSLDALPCSPHSFRGSDGRVPWPGRDPNGLPWMANPHRRRRLLRLQETQSSAWTALLRICASIDPANLTARGAPPDEYSHEVTKIMLRISPASTESEIACVVAQVFSTAFDTVWNRSGSRRRRATMRESAYTEIAREFWHVLTNAEGLRNQD
jgi:hypothetical protein